MTNEKIVVEPYHKGIHQKYSRLYIKITIINENFFEDDISQLLKTYFQENNTPFETDKTYEVIISPDYISSDDDVTYIEEKLFTKAEILRSTLETVGINVDIVYVFGNSVSENPKIIIELDEQIEAREKNTFIMANEEIYNRLLNYCQKLLLNIYLEDENLTSKERKKIIRFINKNHENSPSLLEEEADKYYWAMQINQTKDRLEIINKKDNGFLSFNLEGKIWVQSTFSKIHDGEKKSITKSISDLACERVANIFKQLLELDNGIVCDILDIPFTDDTKLISKAFINQYKELGYIFDEESKIAFDKFKNKVEETMNKFDFIIKNGNKELKDKVSYDKISISDAYSLLQNNISDDKKEMK